MVLFGNGHGPLFEWKSQLAELLESPKKEKITVNTNTNEKLFMHSYDLSSSQQFYQHGKQRTSKFMLIELR